MTDSGLRIPVPEPPYTIALQKDLKKPNTFECERDVAPYLEKAKGKVRDN